MSWLLKQQREDQQKLINTQGGIISDLQEGLIPFEGKVTGNLYV
jgi:hypothetical protein